MKKLTDKELELVLRASRILGSPIKPETNITALSYVLDGKGNELEELIKLKETAGSAVNEPKSK